MSYPFLSAFPFDDPEPPHSLSDYAPVFRVRDRQGEWVAKQTDRAHSSGIAIGAWLAALRREGLDVVAPAARFAPNPRELADGRNWVVYPYIAGEPYSGSAEQIAMADALLGRMHAIDVLEALGLNTFEEPIFRSAQWLAPHVASAKREMQRPGYGAVEFTTLIEARRAQAQRVMGLPLAGCSFDFKASNLVFTPTPVLVDPDHAARIPRLYDLAVAALLFHNDLRASPGRLWSKAEWHSFLAAYQAELCLTDAERARWMDVLRLAWLDQGVWLLGNFPEGWADASEVLFLYDLAALDLNRFAMP
jgi:spectinomycin phosphotransferase